MIEVLEIPVFLSDFDYVADLFQEDLIVDFEGTDFKYYTLTLQAEKEIIFYFLVVKETIENKAILDRLIPKSPFCFIILKGNAFVINNFCESYKERYSNPLVCLFPNGKNDFDLTYINNNVLKNGINQYFEIQPGDSTELKRILKASLNHLLKGQE